MPSPFAVGSLFSGVGGLELGLEWALAEAGFSPRTLWQVEKDVFCRGILQRHWPDAVRHDDVRTVGAHNLAPVDLICGGSPCQDLSHAGDRAGLAGERSGLWSEQARIIRELRPRFAVWENVPGARSPIRDDDGRVVEQPAIATVLGDLSACGYDALWFSVSVADVGGPQLRERVFIVGWLADALRIEGGERSDADVLGRWAADAEQARVGGGDLAGVGLADPCGERLKDSGNFTAKTPEDRGGKGVPLAHAVKAERPWLTPTVEDAGRAGSQEWAERWAKGETPPTSHQRLRTQVMMGETDAPALELNPEWVEHLQGLPVGWTRRDGPQDVAPRKRRGKRPA